MRKRGRGECGGAQAARKGKQTCKKKQLCACSWSIDARACFFPSKIRPHSYQAVSSQGGIGFTQVGGAGYPRRPQLQVHDSKHNVCGYSSWQTSVRVWHTHVVLAAAPEHEVMGVVEKLRAVIVIDSPHAVVAVQEPDATI